MQQEPLSGHLVSEFNHVPSGQMVIRRYQDLNRRFIKNFFQKGPFCRHMTAFDDQNEGLLGNPGYDDAIRGALAAAGSTQSRVQMTSLLMRNLRLHWRTSTKRCDINISPTVGG